MLTRLPLLSSEHYSCKLKTMGLEFAFLDPKRVAVRECGGISPQLVELNSL